VVPAILTIVALPAVAWWRVETHGKTGTVSDSLFAQLALLACATSLVVWLCGRAVTRRLLRRRLERLRAYLNDPASA
jgi:hypothetical protein